MPSAHRSKKDVTGAPLRRAGEEFEGRDGDRALGGGCAGEDQPNRACNAAQRTERGPKYGREIARRSVGVCWRLKGFGLRVNSDSAW